MAASAADEDEEKEYEFPGDIEGSTEKHRIFSPKMRKDALKVLCRRYGLGVSGTVAALQAKLRAFSEDCNQWTLLKAGARRTHKGPQHVPGGKKKSLKGAQLRREEWLGQLEVPDLHSASTGSNIHKGNLVAWAREFRKRYPTRPHSPKTVTDNNEKPNVHPMFGGQFVVDTLGEILNRLPSPPSTPDPIPSSSTAVVLANVPQEATGPVMTWPPALTPNPFPQTPQTPQGQPPQLPEVVELEQGNTFANEVRMLKLAKGPALQFTLSEAAAQDPNRKAISFAHDIDRLGCTWTDTYEHFDGKLCDIKVNGRGIPIQYWHRIFKIYKPLRKQMNDWQWVAEHYVQSTPEEFWDEFSVSSDSNAKVRMTWKQITEALRQRRLEADFANGVGFRQRRRKSCI